MGERAHSAHTWRRVAVGVKEQNSKDNLAMVAAGVAFYAFLAIFPGLVALVSIYGLIADPSDVQSAAEQMRGVVPGGAAGILERQMSKVAGNASSSLGLGMVVGIAAALWSANKGTKALITALEVAYDQEEQRGFLKLNGLSLLITLAAVVGVVLALGAVAILPIILNVVPLPGGWGMTINWLRWPLVGVLVAGALVLFYRYAPDRPVTNWKVLWVGAIVATLLWLLVSALFSWYASSFGSYNETYGSLAAVVVLLMWFFLSAYAILIGAEVTSLLARREPAAGQGTG